MDHEGIQKCDILFLSDSLKLDQQTLSLNSFSDRELELITRCLRKKNGQYDRLKVEFSASVKCPDVKENDLKPSDREICRQYLYETVERADPKLIFCCGNLPLVMLLKKSGITENRGTSFIFEHKGKEYKVVPLFHPFSVILEPKNKRLFMMDIDNAINKYVLGIKDTYFTYEVLEDIKDLKKFKYLETTDKTIAIDTEAEGLDFTIHKVTTVSIVDADENVLVFAIDHKENPHSEYKDEVLSFLKKVLENPRNRKVYHHAKYDLKMLKRYKIYPINIWDTELMYHLIDEDSPKRLIDLVKRFFPETIEEL